MADPLPEGFRHQPNNTEAEQALLGAILIRNEGYHRVAHIVKSEHFYEPVHRRIFAHMAGLIGSGKLADHITLQRAFENDDALKELNGAKYLAGLARAAETILNVEDYATLIRDLAVKRDIIHITQQATNLAFDPQAAETAPEMLAKLFDDINRVGDNQANAVVSIDVVAALEAPRPQRKWIVQDWIPQGRLTLLSGDGGSGKSLIAQQLATSVATGLPWLRNDVKRGRVSFFATEDDQDEITIRHQDIVSDLKAHEIEIGEHLRLIPRVGMENRLIEFEGDRGIITPTWHVLRRHLEMFEPKLLILDNASQIFAGNENSRPHVTWFCNRLEHLCQTYKTTIILLGHTAKALGSEFSGSTAWNASVRSRIFLGPHEEDEDTKTLTRAKSNYAKDGDQIQLQWHDGTLRIHHPGQVSEEDLSRARQAFKDALDKLCDRGINVSQRSKSTKNYAPKVMMEEGLVEDFSLKILHKAMMSLIDDGSILTDQTIAISSHRNQLKGMIRVGRI